MFSGHVAVKLERLVLKGLATLFLVELAIGIPAVLRRNATDDDTQATSRPVTAQVSASSTAPLPTVEQTATAVTKEKSIATSASATAKPVHVPSTLAPHSRRGAVVDDLPRADASATFSYFGPWEHVRGLRDGRTAGTSSRTYKPESFAILSFSGTQVRLIGVCGPRGGRAMVFIKGRSDNSLVDFYAPIKETHMLVYRSPRLPAGPHRLFIIVAPQPHAARKRYVNIDGAEYDS